MISDNRNTAVDETQPGLTRIFMSLQHQLRSPVFIPKLHTTILRTRDDPLAIMRYGDGEHIIFMTREIEHALAEPLAGFTGVADGRVEFPVLERLIERAGD